MLMSSWQRQRGSFRSGSSRLQSSDPLDTRAWAPPLLIISEPLQKYFPISQHTDEFNTPRPDGGVSLSTVTVSVSSTDNSCSVMATTVDDVSESELLRRCTVITSSATSSTTYSQQVTWQQVQPSVHMVAQKCQPISKAAHTTPTPHWHYNHSKPLRTIRLYWLYSRPIFQSIKVWLHVNIMAPKLVKSCVFTFSSWSISRLQK